MDFLKIVKENSLIIVSAVATILILSSTKKKKFDIKNFAFDIDGKYPDQTFGYTVGEYPTNGKNSRLVTFGGVGNNWGGTMGRALAFAKVSENFLNKNILTSQKRDWLLTASGNISDHSTTNKVGYGVDLACDVPTGDKLIEHLMKWFGNDQYRGGKWYSVIKNGYRYNIGWRVPGHFNHIHVGVRKVV